MSDRRFFVRCAAFVVSVIVCTARPAFPVEPGIDIAAPRVAVTTVDGSTLAFHPPRLTIEQGDHVRWSALASSIHTTTSGMPCLADGLWNQSLGVAGTNFTRLFAEPPRVFPFFCSPHCTVMSGQITLTTVIALTMNDTAGTPRLSWTGGGGSYVVYRSDAPNFRPTATSTIAPDGGSSGTTLTDLVSPQPDSGRANYYLVMNLF